MSTRAFPAVAPSFEMVTLSVVVSIGCLGYLCIVRVENTWDEGCGYYWLVGVPVHS